ncbi:MAG: DGQHR domain-containing protein [Candidatus Pacearchaeota archaeon]|nr:MAG: DGQHR domain-containing protein [Candidatus Pacearchaeota archaeon]
MSKEYIIIKKLIKIKQPMGDFLVGVMKAKDLLKITKANPRHYNEELDTYAGIQREINDKKIKQLKKFIMTSDATFPNTIIGALKPDKFDFDGKKSTLKIEKNPESFAVIDGQHRLASFKNESLISNDFDLIVSFFLGLDLEEQAYLFSIINMTQKKLNPSLVQDLTELFTIITPEKLAHNLATVFNNEKKSPWFKKIKMLGKNVGSYKGVLSQYTFTKGITELIADVERYYEIRDILKNNKKRKSLESLKMDSEKYVLWKHYINEEDNFIYKLLNVYFITIKKVFQKEWGNKNYILTKTTGYNAFMRLLRDLHKKAENQKCEMTEEFFEKYLKIIKRKIKPLISKYYNPGKQGENRLYEALKKALK